MRLRLMPKKPKTRAGRSEQHIFMGIEDLGGGRCER